MPDRDELANILLKSLTKRNGEFEISILITRNVRARQEISPKNFLFKAVPIKLFKLLRLILTETLTLYKVFDCLVDFRPFDWIY